MISEMSENVALEFVGRKVVGHLGCVLASGEPYVVPISYFLKDGEIYIHTLPGLKLDAMRANPKVCLTVTETLEYCNWKSVVVFGEFEEIVNQDEIDRVLSEMFKHFQGLTPVEAITIQNIVTVFRINIKRITGRTEN